MRTLHYYEEIGLLAASRRSAAGHRLYGDDDVARLYRICLLRDLGLPLEEIARALDDAAWDLRAALARHLDELDRRLAEIGRLRGRVAHLCTAEGVDGAPTDDLLTVMEAMTMPDTTAHRRIAFLAYADVGAAHDHLVEVFGLGAGQVTRDDDGRVIHAELHAGDGVIWLHPESADFALASPRTLGGATAGVAVMVDDVDAHHRRATDHGATVLHAPVDQPYGYREYSARDVEGGLWSFMQRLA